MTRNPKTHCLEDLRARVLSQDIAPGSDLDEMTLSEHYGISRTPLREVLHRLAGDGYVDLANNRTAKVTSMDLAVMRTFFQTAPLIYCNIAKLAAENRTSAQVELLKDSQIKFAAAAKNSDAHGASLLNHRFHEQIGAMSQNPYLIASLNRMLIDHTRLSQTFFRPATPADKSRVAKAISHHDAMISAIEAREPSLAIDLTLQHWDLSRDQLEKFVQPDPLPLDVVSLKDKRNAI